MELSLGLFGDERLERTGLFFASGLLATAGAASASDSLAVGGPARCGLRVFYTIPE